MLKLRGKTTALKKTMSEPCLLTVTTKSDLPTRLRQKYALLCENGIPSAEGYAAVLVRGEVMPTHVADAQAKDIYQIGEDYAYLAEGDIVRLNPHQDTLSVLFRVSSPSNTILLTEQCNHYCLMCSQPPKKVDDFWILDEVFELIRLIPASTPSLGFSGGEPTLYGERFIALVQHVKNYLPHTRIDILTNGRAFNDPAFAQALGKVAHPDLTLGIPLYSDDPVRHDYVVQSSGAFDETVKGILNLKGAKVRVEIRVVVHRETLPRLVQTCRFIARNLLFVNHVALMGLEITGFTRANLDQLWIDPHEYKDTLSEAAGILMDYGIKASIYNHQLCLVNGDLHSIYRKSISDWKNEYLDECSSCERKVDCGGFFSSSVQYRHSKHIRPLAASSTARIQDGAVQSS
ncbi:His-Xaa-Ser system radical SAM maturase HxsC [Variovorax sp. LjRoot178]|uniref:His-Xaa-Ser system radical SAM maturase HxsC n=1 Tax=Variovorax sp. LjRoot178 TaxID=3342277 RepID=UPI003ECDCC2E